MRTEEQYLASLAKANAIRIEWGHVRRALAELPRLEAEQSCALLLENLDDTTGRMEVVYLLRAIPRWGPTRARKTCIALGIPQDKRLGNLSDRQRNLLATFLRADQRERNALRVATAVTTPQLTNQPRRRKR